jgi:hypothetical protein
MIEVVRAFEPMPEDVIRTIFLAGPTPRSTEVESWRPEAIELLTELGFHGHVFVPETNNQADWKNGFEAQEEWEHEALSRADVILFWIPRDLSLDSEGEMRMPAFTTNIEFGEHMKSGRVILGYPPHTKKIGALTKKAQRYNVPVRSTLRETLKGCIDCIGDGAKRVEGECSVPLIVWRQRGFQKWYQSIKEENWLVNARVISRYPFGHFTIDVLGIEVELEAKATNFRATKYLTL